MQTPEDIAQEFKAMLKKLAEAGYVLSAQIGLRKMTEEEQKNFNFEKSIQVLPQEVQDKIKKIPTDK